MTGREVSDNGLRFYDDEPSSAVLELDDKDGGWGSYRRKDGDRIVRTGVKS